MGEKAGQSVLDLPVVRKNDNNNNDNILPVKDILEKLRAGELKMDYLSADTQTMVRKGALEMKNCQDGVNTSLGKQEASATS